MCNSSYFITNHLQNYLIMILQAQMIVITTILLLLFIYCLRHIDSYSVKHMMLKGILTVHKDKEAKQ